MSSQYRSGLDKGADEAPFCAARQRLGLTAWLGLTILTLGTGCTQSTDARSNTGADKTLAKTADQPARQQVPFPAEGHKMRMTTWRQLAAFLPDKLGDYTAEGDTRGMDYGAELQPRDGAPKIKSPGTLADRRYTAGERRAKVEIGDELRVNALKEALHTLEPKSFPHYQQMFTQVLGNFALTEWREPEKWGSVSILVADRFAVNVTVEHASDPSDAIKLAQRLDLKQLAKVVGEARE